jgi:hypothetical protein
MRGVDAGVQVLRTVTHDKQTGHELAVNEFTTFVLGTGALFPGKLALFGDLGVGSG